MDRRQRVFLWLAGLFVTSLVTGDLIGGKLFRIGGIDLSVGMIPFPLTFVLTDVVNEFYGAEGARRITYLGLGMAVFVFAVINLAIALPPSPHSLIPEDAFRGVLGSSSRLYAASLTAYVIGQLLDIAVFGFFRRLTGHRFIWLRATGSTVVSQLVDTVTVNGILLWGKKDPAFIARIAVSSYVVKLVVAVGLTPLVYAGHALVRRAFEAQRSQPPAPATSS